MPVTHVVTVIYRCLLHKLELKQDRCEQVYVLARYLRYKEDQGKKTDRTRLGTKCSGPYFV